MEQSKEKSKIIIISTFITVLIIIDQLIKFLVINRNFNIIYIENIGGAFGVGQDSLFSFIVANIVVLGLIIKFILNQKDRLDDRTFVALNVVLAGGFSNLIERIFRGFITEYIKVFELPKLNLADLYIVVGLGCIVIFFILNSRKEVKHKR